MQSATRARHFIFTTTVVYVIDDIGCRPFLTTSAAVRGCMQSVCLQRARHNRDSDVIARRRIGTANASEDDPSGGNIAPEDRGVGSPSAAHSPVNVSFHAIDTTQKPQLREAGVNFWYRDPAEVTAPATEWFNTGSASFAIQPHETTTLGPYTCHPR
jgi:hypothetical protein